MKTIPLIVDDVRDNISRCNYFYVVLDEDNFETVKITSPDNQEIFDTVESIENIFDKYESKEQWVDIGYIHVSNSLLQEPIERGNVYRIPEDKFKKMVKKSKSNDFVLPISQEETQAFKNWSKRQQDIADQQEWNKPLPKKEH